MLRAFIEKHYSGWVSMASDYRCFKSFVEEDLGMVSEEWSELKVWEVWILYPFVLASANVPLLKHLQTLGHNLTTQPDEDLIKRSQLLDKPVLQVALGLVSEEEYVRVFKAYKEVSGNFKVKNGSLVCPTDLLFVEGKESLRDECVSIIGWDNLSIFSVVMCNDFDYVVKAINSGVDIHEEYKGHNVLFNMIKFFDGSRYSIGPINKLGRQYTEQVFDHILSLGLSVNSVRFGDTLLNLAHGYREEKLKEIIVQYGGVGSESSRYPLDVPSTRGLRRSGLFLGKL